jgi:SAM-dependent methyltransferase
MPEKINQLFCNIKKVLKNDGTLIISVPADVESHGSKDYQYFSAQSLTEYLEPHFGKIEIVGQDKMGVHFLELVYKLLDNRFWLIRPLAEYYNLHIWAKYFNRGELNKSRRLIARAVKINA